jgi:hypothetical protein
MCGCLKHNGRVRFGGRWRQRHEPRLATSVVVEIVPADGHPPAANWKKRRLRYVAVFGQLFRRVNVRVHKYAPKIKNNRRHLLLCFGSPCGRTGRSPSKVDNFAGGHHMATIGSPISRLVGRHLNRRRRRLYSFVGRLSPVPLQEFHVREARRQ